MDLVLLVDFLLPVTLKDSRKSTTPMSHLTGAGKSKGKQSGNLEGRPEMAGALHRAQEHGFSAGGWLT